MLARSGVIDFGNLQFAKTESDLPHIFTSLPERAHAFPMRIGQAVLTSPAIGVYPAELDKLMDAAAYEAYIAAKGKEASA